jgi:hypothetical protein
MKENIAFYAVKYLLTLGLDPEEQDLYEDTTFLIAIDKGHIDIV